jgi:hypothetical protein
MSGATAQAVRTFLVAALIATSSIGTLANEPQHAITRRELQSMFKEIAKKSGWDMSKDMLWGYFFTNSTRAPLERIAQQLQAQGYTVVNIHLSDKAATNDPDFWWLHIEKVEAHTVTSLDARNQEFYRLAAANRLDSYDGMDVGPVEGRK